MLNVLVQADSKLKETSSVAEIPSNLILGLRTRQAKIVVIAGVCLFRAADVCLDYSF